MATDRKRPRGPVGPGAAALAAATTEGGWALVTGASSGIGLAYATALATRGVNLLLTSVDAVNLERVTAELRDRHGVRVESLCQDFAAETVLGGLPDLIADRRVEILVNNAGFGTKGLFTATDAATYTDMVRVNLLAPVLLTRALLPPMLARGRGAVVHVASINAIAPIAWSAVYSATKAFLLSYATAVWYENRGSGVAFQTLLPGTSVTPFHTHSGSTRLPPWAMTPEAVAASSLAALGRAVVHVPGAVNRVLRALDAFLPLPLRTKTAVATAVMRRSLGV
ncbi:dehydrogenase [Planotetraspora thailandica]|uniref:Dehydrogenase n=1 Tax=Planotetraspora thailandica TaxID=487172 RepID=A0A8J3V235_9ACTN|nr:SDR family NAD(P)-dependent oxidoreductase [Planotetraspora thailandica]GII56038.1 dehydrogenase [Planotetraspora thailandica]